jgi:hypothetical protein
MLGRGEAGDVGLRHGWPWHIIGQVATSNNYMRKLAGYTTLERNRWGNQVGGQIISAILLVSTVTPDRRQRKRMRVRVQMRGEMIITRARH